MVSITIDGWLNFSFRQLLGFGEWVNTGLCLLGNSMSCKINVGCYEGLNSK